MKQKIANALAPNVMLQPGLSHSLFLNFSLFARQFLLSFLSLFFLPFVLFRSLFLSHGVCDPRSLLPLPDFFSLVHLFLIPTSSIPFPLFSFSLSPFSYLFPLSFTPFSLSFHLSRLLTVISSFLHTFSFFPQLSPPFFLFTSPSSSSSTC